MAIPATGEHREGLDVFVPQLKASQIAPELVARAIASAIAAGWEPLSRGKVVTIVVDESGG